MANNKVWVLKYVVGNPRMFSKVFDQPPMTKSEVEEHYDGIHDGWRKWIEHKDSGKILKMNDVEKRWREGEFKQ